MKISSETWAGASTTADMSADAHHMTAALALAGRGLGEVWPNPSVGCVIVKHGHVVGRGRTQRGGRPHAEVVALTQAGSHAAGATAYVSLEPCCHHGQTPPCTDALIAAGISRVVIALEDPDPRVSGGGIARLTQAGLAVTTGVLAEQARHLNQGFILSRTQGRPLIALKLAVTLDGRIAATTGASRWITQEPARRRVHLMRTTYDAVMVGSGTALADDPELTCRLPGLEDRIPVSIVVDRTLSMPRASRLAKAARTRPVWVIASDKIDPQRKAFYEDLGISVVHTPEMPDNTPDMRHAVAALADRGLTRILVEGGSYLAAALLNYNLVDRMVWFRAPGAMGGDGLPALQSLGVQSPDDIKRFRRISAEAVGEDLMEIYES